MGNNEDFYFLYIVDHAFVYIKIFIQFLVFKSLILDFKTKINDFRSKINDFRLFENMKNR